MSHEEPTVLSGDPEPGRAVLERLDQVVFETDPVGNWTYLSPAWERLTGFSVAESLGRPFLDFLHPEEVERTLAMFYAVVSGGATSCAHDARYRTADGSYVALELRARVLRGASGEVLGNVGTLRDITEQAAAQGVLAEHVALLEVVSSQAGTADRLPVGTVVYGCDLIVARRSPLLVRLFGPAVAPGAPITSLLQACDRTEGSVRLGGEHGLVATARATGQPQYASVVLPAAEARPRHLHVSVLPLHDASLEPDAEGNALALVVQDVSELRRAERQQAAIGRLGRQALAGGDVGQLLHDASRTVAETLDSGRAAVLDVVVEGERVLLRTAYGWPEGAWEPAEGAAPPLPALVARALGCETPVVDENLLIDPAVRHHAVFADVPALAALAAPAAPAALAVRVGAGSAYEPGSDASGGPATGGRTTGTVLVVPVPTLREPAPFLPDEVDFAGSVASLLGVGVERRRAEECMRHQALHDPLTGLANRALLEDRLRLALSSRRRTGTSSALLLLDLDRFKEINDTLGHDVGDELLRLVGGRLEDAVRDTDTVARLGGDEFAVVLTGIRNEEDALRVAEKLRARVTSSFEVQGVPLQVAGSVGVALAPTQGEDVATLLKRADVAMYRAKRLLSGVAVYSREDDWRRPPRLAHAAALRSAVEQDELVMQYQPKVDIATRRVTAVEALVRWQHPVEGLVLPGVFLPAAERSGLIEPITQRVLTLALLQARSWSEHGRAVPVSVNISARVLHDTDLVETVTRELRRLQLPPTALHLEVAESAVMASPVSAMRVATRLAAAGVHLSMDDFGTGYSSLTYLRDLPVQQIKIDGSFVRNLLTSEGDAALVRAAIDLAHDLGLQVVGEGVESEEVLRALGDLGCDEAQGYHLGRPMSPQQILAALS